MLNQDYIESSPLREPRELAESSGDRSTHLFRSRIGLLMTGFLLASFDRVTFWLLLPYLPAALCCLPFGHPLRSSGEPYTQESRLLRRLASVLCFPRKPRDHGGEANLPPSESPRRGAYVIPPASSPYVGVLPSHVIPGRRAKTV